MQEHEIFDIYGGRMELITDRLIIRNIQFNDWKELKNIWQNFGESPYAQYDVPHSNDDEQIQRLVKHFAESNDYFIVTHSKTERVIGTIDLHDTGNGYDIGYCFMLQYQGNVYAKESCSALIDLYVKNGCKRFSAGTALNNTPSVKLLNTLGFHLTGAEQVTFYKDKNGNDIYFEGGLFELLI